MNEYKNTNNTTDREDKIGVTLRVDKDSAIVKIDAANWPGLILAALALVLTVVLWFMANNQISALESQLARIEGTDAAGRLAATRVADQQPNAGGTVTAGGIVVSSSPDTDNGTAEGGRAEWTFGGPYPFKRNPQKLTNFQYYKQYHQQLRLPLTNVAVLASGLLKNSLERNKHNPKGDEFQRYNYVISVVNGRLEVRVAVWDSSAIDGIAERLPQQPADDAARYKQWLDAVKKSDLAVMVDFYPDEAFENVGHDRHGPQRVNIPFEEGFRGFGILDAVSKHFLLAQEDPDVRTFLPETWLEAKVAYAGELLIDVKRMFYVLNANSGTYQPDGTYLEAVAGVFESDNVLGVAPKYLQTFGAPVREYRSGTSSDLGTLQ